MSTKIEWKASHTTNAAYIGIIEFQSNDSEYHNFEILSLEDRLLFGGMCNMGFLESGYILKDGFSNDEVLETLLMELECYYNDGSQYTSMIVFNERM